MLGERHGYIMKYVLVPMLDFSLFIRSISETFVVNADGIVLWKNIIRGEMTIQILVVWVVNFENVPVICSAIISHSLI